MPSHGSLTKSGKVAKLHEPHRKLIIKRGKKFRRLGRPSPRLRRRNQFKAFLRRKRK